MSTRHRPRRRRPWYVHAALGVLLVPGFVIFATSDWLLERGLWWVLVIVVTVAGALIAMLFRWTDEHEGPPDGGVTSRDESEQRHGPTSG